MKRVFFVMAGCLLGILLEQGVAQKPETPKQGTQERQAICDGARAFVLKEYVTGRLPQPLVFKINRLLVQGEWCSFEALPLFKDGSPVSTEYIMDIRFNLCLRKEGGRWVVVSDLSRTDVPEASEVQAIRRRMPAEFPIELLSPFWQDLFRRAGR